MRASWSAGSSFLQASNMNKFPRLACATPPIQKHHRNPVLPNLSSVYYTMCASVRSVLESGRNLCSAFALEGNLCIRGRTRSQWSQKRRVAHIGHSEARTPCA